MSESISNNAAEQEVTDDASVSGAGCTYIYRSGEKCNAPVTEGHLCKWHDSEQVLTDPAIMLNLQEQAKTHKKLCGYQLANTNLSGIDLVNHGEQDGYKLINSDLYRADLSYSHLFRLDLSNSSLMKTNLKGANLNFANLSNANLLGVRLDNASIDAVRWGDKVLQEIQAEKATDHDKKIRYCHEAEEVYRNLRIVHDNQGYSQLAGYFFRREMIMRRLQMPLISYQRFISKLIDLFTGYGEQPEKIVAFSMFVIVFFAVIYAYLGVSYQNEIIRFSPENSVVSNMESFLNCIYYSVVTFTTLGYGDMTPLGVTRLFAAFEAFIGAFTMALFVVTVSKKTSR